MPVLPYRKNSFALQNYFFEFLFITACSFFIAKSSLILFARLIGLERSNPLAGDGNPFVLKDGQENQSKTFPLTGELPASINLKTQLLVSK